MDNNTAIMLHNSIMFAVSCAFDLVFLCIIVFLFYKLQKTKEVVVENNREIYDHDRTLMDIQEQIKNG